ncbi:hypothetical protein PanWU01x14_294520 [Parasponia andersonii]|uniref:Uncharacterized protein n=1 Tax=Parasponia andersonii TaxID=3476 RepID=A0A2P5AW89_PARAD|nr:hypothetical protein PanWU01x14_294520 [Parasponia andersonii]
MDESYGICIYLPRLSAAARRFVVPFGLAAAPLVLACCWCCRCFLVYPCDEAVRTSLEFDAVAPFELSKRLVQQGFSVTFVNTRHIHEKVQNATSLIDDDDGIWSELIGDREMELHVPEVLENGLVRRATGRKTMIQPKISVSPCGGVPLRNGLKLVAAASSEEAL